MKIEIRNSIGVKLIGILLIFANFVLADYLEGIDTTDLNGYGLDSAFQVSNGNILGQNIVFYHMSGTLNGYFNYAFDDIKMAMKSASCVKTSGQLGECTFCTQYSNQSKLGNYCFVIHKFKDSTFSKIQILNNIANNRYVFRYGTNTSPNNCLMVKTPYDSSIRYKPNNFCNIYSYYNCSGDFPSFESCSWEPPLLSNNHLLGYLIYRPKSGVFIDTTQPINLAQWDSVNFTTSTFGGWSMSIKYLGLVAVYKEGKSDFLKNWWTPKITEFLVSNNTNSTPINKIQNKMEIKQTSNGLFISLSSLPRNTGSSCFSIYNAKGLKVAEFPRINSNQVFWKTTNQNLAPGQYFGQLELTDKRFFCGRLVLSK